MTRIKIIFCGVLLFLPLMVFSQIYRMWEAKMGEFTLGSTYSYPGLDIDADGNIYGYFGKHNLFPSNSVPPVNIIRLSPEGTVEWKRGLKISDSYESLIYTTILPDSSYLYLERSYDGCLRCLKVSLTGDSLLTKSMCWNQEIQFRDASTDEKGNTYTLFRTDSANIEILNVFKFDINGNLRWHRSWSKADQYNTTGNIEAKKGRVMVYHRYIPWHLNHLYCLDTAGNQLWMKDVSSPQYHSADILIDESKNTYLVRQTGDSFLKFDSSGNKLVDKPLGNLLPRTGTALGPDSSIYFVKRAGNEVFLVKKDLSGNLLWESSAELGILNASLDVFDLLVIGDKFVVINGTTDIQNGINWPPAFVSVFDQNGNHIGNDLIPDVDELNWTFKSLIADPLGSFYLAYLRRKPPSPSTIQEFRIRKYCIDCEPNILGKVYLDGNNSCTPEINEPAYPYQPILVNSDDLYFTKANGDYSLAKYSGQYSITHPQPPAWSHSCQIDTININLQPDSTCAGNNFGMIPFLVGPDLFIQGTHTAFMPGFNVGFNLVYGNFGTQAVNSNISVSLDSLLTFNSSTPPPTNIQGNQLTWNLNLFHPFQFGQIKINTTLSASTPLGDAVSNQITINPIPGDLVPVDNTLILEDTTTGSYDPNDLRVEPRGLGQRGYIGRDQDHLVYKIRFQNTGTNTAFRVVVTDEIPLGLDIKTIEILGISHDCEVSSTGNRKLVFTFDNILLPDSGANQLESNGFIIYRIKLDPLLPDFHEFPNSVNIYFDFNEPVRTNSTINTISPTECGPSCRIAYPNPAGDYCWIEINSEWDDMVTVEFLDMQGRWVRREKIQNPSAPAYYSLKGIPKGIYFMIIKDSTKWRQQKMVILGGNK
ncbi:MAG: T9SS type A sorting domain-containing protein [Bacteroidia bacterium]|nr:T9SS type A sorting domain-containing protein [Bacteroidia bacterium]